MHKTANLLKKFLKRFGNDAAELWDQFEQKLKEGELGSNDCLFRDDLTQEERDEIDYQVRLDQLEDRFSNNVSLALKKPLIRLDLLDFEQPESNRFSFDNLSNKLQSDFIRDHLDNDGKLDSDIEYSRREFRNLFRKYGEDVRPSDVFTKEELEICMRLSEEDIPKPEDLEKAGVKELLIAPLSENKPPGWTPKGDIAHSLCSLNYGTLSARKVLGEDSEPQNYHKDFDKPLRLNVMFRELYHPPNSYNRIIRDYYDLTEGFSYVSPELLERGWKLFNRLNLLSMFTDDTFFDSERFTQHDKFVEMLIEQGALKKEEASNISKYFFQGLSNEYRKGPYKLNLFVFVVALLFKDEYPSEYNRYVQIIRKYLEDLENAWWHRLTPINHPGSVTAESPPSGIKPPSVATLKLQQIDSDKLPKRINEIIQNPMHPSETLQASDESEISPLTLRLDLIATDLHTLMRNNMIFFCVFYDFLFDGEKQLKEDTVPHRARNYPEFIDTILVCLVNLFKDRKDFNSERYKLTGEFLFGLTGIRISVKDRYHNWKDRVNPSDIDAS